jgi:hypothetical protein
MGKSRDEHLADAERHARSAQRWSTAAIWGSGCALALWVVPVIVGVVVAIWVVIASR